MLDTRVAQVVRIERAALDESETSPDGVVMRGRIAPSTLRFLEVDKQYQRDLEVRDDIAQALKAGEVVPDIDVGVRGQAMKWEGDDCLIASPCFVIDGWQRVGNARRLLEEIGDIEIRLGALLHFGTGPDWEAARFTRLNNNAKRVSANLHLRNLRNQNHAVATLYGLTTSEANCPLKGRVAWNQNRHRDELVGSFLIAKVMLRLHAHRSLQSSRIDQLAGYLGQAAATVTLPVFRHNCLTFSQLIEAAWGIRAITYKRSAPQIKGTFMLCLADVLSRHANFWDGERLDIGAFWRRRFAAFPINDPHIAEIAGQGGTARKILYSTLIEHLDNGLSSNRLVRRT